MTDTFEYFKNSFINSFNREKEFEIIYFMLKNYNFRISEILNLSIASLIPSNTIIVKLSKSSDYYVFHDEGIYNCLFYIFDRNYENKFSLTYDEFKRWFIKHHSQDIITGLGKNAKITHAFRYKNAAIFDNCLKNEKEIQALLRHKSKKTQKYYLKKKT